MKKDIYYLFSSITFLQFFIPIVIECNKRGYNNIFIFNVNITKEYANIFEKNNYKIIKQYLDKYKIKEIRSDEIDLSKIKSLFFMIDGDIYGPPRKIALKNSLLSKLSRESIKISLTEHMNFWAVYHYFIDKINYACFTNENIISQMDQLKNKNIKIAKDVNIKFNKSFKNKKNIFLGSTKFENIPAKEFIYSKFNLSPNNKYCLFLFPKIRGYFKKSNILNIYSHLNKLGYKIIVKQRPKDNDIDKSLKGDIFVCSDIYPNESLELMKISDFCIISSSSANEETIFSEIPCIDLISDLRPWERNQYLLDDRTYIRVENEVWKNISYEDFSKILNKLEPKNSKYYKKIKEKFNLNITNCSELILNFIKY